jgi:hypothetical protein
MLLKVFTTCAPAAQRTISSECACVGDHILYLAPGHRQQDWLAKLRRLGICPVTGQVS